MHGAHLSLLLATLAVSSAQTHSAKPASSLQSKVDAYVQPLVETRNFSGCILVARDGVALLDRCYGMANYELEKPNTPRTRFHIASVSKSFTGAAILLLEQQGKLLAVLTQNVDGLHLLAGTSAELLVEVHGNMREVECLQCGERAPMERALWKNGTRSIGRSSSFHLQACSR